MSRKFILFLVIMISTNIVDRPLNILATGSTHTDWFVSRGCLPVQSAHALNQAELQKFVDLSRGRLTPDQMKRIRDAVKQSGILDEFKEAGLSSLVLSPSEKKRVILYTNRIAQIHPPHKGRKRLPLASVLRPLFILARERAKAGKEPVMENRAAILAASLFAKGADLSLVLGKDAAMALRPKIKPRQVTLSGRHDLTLHFLSSAALALTVGPEQAHRVGLEKELSDSRGGSGFSFVDLAANRAGIQLALTATAFPEEAQMIQIRMGRIKKDTDIMPVTTGLPEGLSESKFIRLFENTESKKFLRISKAIDERIVRCPVYWQ
jgi:hypothetical protein